MTVTIDATYWGRPLIRRSFPGNNSKAYPPGSSANGLLHPRSDGGLPDLGDVGDRVHGGPERSVVELRSVLEAELGIPGLELRGRLEVAEDLAVLEVRRHAVPRLVGKLRRSLGDEDVQLLGERTVGGRERGDGVLHGLGL